MFFTAFDIKAQVNRVVLIFPFSLQVQGRGEFNTKIYSAPHQHHYFATDCTDFWRTGIYLNANQYLIHFKM